MIMGLLTMENKNIYSLCQIVLALVEILSVVGGSPWRYTYSGKPKDVDYPDEGGDIILTKDIPLPDDEDDEDSDKSFVTGKNSDDYRLEIALLESKKEKLMKEIGDYELELPRMRSTDWNLSII